MVQLWAAGGALAKASIARGEVQCEHHRAASGACIVGVVETYLARDLAHLLLQFHKHTTPITRRKLCSRVERRARRLAGGCTAANQTASLRFSLLCGGLAQDSSIVTMMLPRLRDGDARRSK